MCTQENLAKFHKYTSTFLAHYIFCATYIPINAPVGAKNKNWYSFLVIQQKSLLTLEIQWIAIGKAVHDLKYGKQ